MCEDEDEDDDDGGNCGVRHGGDASCWRRGGGQGGPEREIVTINFPLMGVQHRNEVVRETERERERSKRGNRWEDERGKRVSRAIALAVTNSRHIVSPTLMT